MGLPGAFPRPVGIARIIPETASRHPVHMPMCLLIRHLDGSLLAMRETQVHSAQTGATQKQ